MSRQSTFFPIVSEVDELSGPTAKPGNFVPVAKPEIYQPPSNTFLLSGGQFSRKKDPLKSSTVTQFVPDLQEINKPSKNPIKKPFKDPFSTKVQRPSVNTKQNAVVKPSLKSTFAPTQDEIDKRPIVFFDITINDIPAGTVFFELFNETVPKTAENFRVLVTGTCFDTNLPIRIFFFFCKIAKTDFT